MIPAYSETLELSWNVEPNRTESNRTELNLNDFTWCIWCIWMIFMSSVRSNRTRKNIEILKKFEPREAMFNSIWFDSVGEKSSRVSLYVVYQKNRDQGHDCFLTFFDLQTWKNFDLKIHKCTKFHEGKN